MAKYGMSPNGELIRYPDGSWARDDPTISLRDYFLTLYGVDLTDEQWDDVLANYSLGRVEIERTKSSEGVGKVNYRSLDTDRLLDDLRSMSSAMSEEPVAPEYSQYLDDARAQIESENQAMYADLDKLLEQRTNIYNDDLRSLSNSYGDMRTGLLSQQAQQNSQLMDTLQSGMERSRRNALESGASAGLRIAENINTLLTAQNKQSATSMDTANQLAQMMVNQRNAESSIRNNYANKLAEDTANRHSIQLGSEQRAKSLADTNYQSAYSSYDNAKTKWDNANAYNPLYDYRNQVGNYETPNYKYNKYGEVGK